MKWKISHRKAVKSEYLHHITTKLTKSIVAAISETTFEMLIYRNQAFVLFKLKRNSLTKYVNVRKSIYTKVHQIMHFSQGMKIF